MTESDGSQLSVLEAGFGHVVTRLVQCWGDPEYFHLVFQDLIIDKRGNRSGWPFDAFMELELLQRVHDEAYGRPALQRDTWDQISHERWR